MITNKAEVRGYSLFERRATISQRTLALLNDCCLICCLDLALSDLCRLSPILNIKSVVALISVGAVYFISFRTLGTTTLGEKIWKLKRTSSSKHKARLFAQNLPDRITQFVSAGMTLISLYISYSAVNRWVIQHPVWAKSSHWEMKPFIPPADQWIVTPFFYVIGGWPRKFDDSPVLYTLPYENGPPHHFVGHIVASLDRGDLKIIIEGPKTPEKIGSQDAVRACFSGKRTSTSDSCVQLRESVLKRHFDEMRTAAIHNWQIKWFQIQTPELTLENQTQGIFISGESANAIQDRFILINRNGINQAIILNRPKNAIGERAFTLVKDLVASLRVFPDLNTGRAWINNELSNVRLDALNVLTDEALVSHQLEEIQVLLLSSISVDPGRFDTYFHLAGTSLMLAKRSISTQDGKNVSALENIRSSYRFAQDVAPDDPRTPEIQSYWLEARKF